MFITINRIIAAIKLGGLKYILLKIIDKLSRGERTADYYYRICESASPADYPRILELSYCMKTGHKMDISNPITFNQKIQWLKLYDSNGIKTRLADKYLVRDYIKEKIGEEYLIPLLGVWDKFDDIDFDQLPGSFALKANHGSGWNIVVKDKNNFNINSAKEQFEKWMGLNFAYVAGLELQYRDIVPRIIAEQYISDDEDGLTDYRLYCFNGERYQVWVDRFSGTPEHIRSIFDLEWNKLPIECKWPDGGNSLSNRPHALSEMVELAKILSKQFSFVRVDFYETSSHVYVGEMTFTPMSGFSVFNPEEYDRKLGDLLNLPERMRN